MSSDSKQVWQLEKYARYDKVKQKWYQVNRDDRRLELIIEKAQLLIMQGKNKVFEMIPLLNAMPYVQGGYTENILAVKITNSSNIRYFRVKFFTDKSSEGTNVNNCNGCVKYLQQFFYLEYQKKSSINFEKVSLKVMVGKMLEKDKNDCSHPSRQLLDPDFPLEETVRKIILEPNFLDLVKRADKTIKCILHQ